MIVKCFEVRDEGTFLPVLAIKTEPANESERYLLMRMGYGTKSGEQRRYVLVSPLGGGRQMIYDPYHWGQNRTLETAHSYIIRNFDALDTGVVIDVEYILGETGTPKMSEAQQ